MSSMHSNMKIAELDLLLGEAVGHIHALVKLIPLDKIRESGDIAGIVTNANSLATMPQCVAASEKYLEHMEAVTGQ